MTEGESYKKEEPIYRSTESFNSAFGLFLRSSWISLVFIFAFVILISTMDQGGSLVVDLFERGKWSLLIFLLIGHAFSLVLSHYPAYLQMWHVERGDYDQSQFGQTKWKMEGIKFLGLGIITFKSRSAFKSKAERIADMLRGYLGVIYHLGIIYILMTTYERYICEPSLTNKASIGGATVFFLLLVAFSLFLHFKLHAVPSRGESALKRLWNLLNGLLFINLATVVILMWSASTHGWCPMAFWMLMIHEVISIVMFSLFRYLRGRALIGEKSFHPLSFLSNHKTYLTLMSGLGWVAGFLFVLSHFFFEFINPIALMICIFYFFYGILLIPTKHHFYYASRPPVKPRVLQWLFTYVVPWSGAIVITLFVLADRFGNGLHRLEVAQVETSSIVSEQEFIDYLNTQLVHDTLSQSAAKPLYFISAYGGGLKANYWNLLLLEKLNEKTKTNVIENTLALSGVSGGAVGQALFLALCHQDLTPKQRRAAISTIGRTDFVSMDISYTCGFDLLREFALGKKNFKHPDRAGRAMKQYGNTIGLPTFTQESYSSFWGARYREATSKGDLFPVLLSNSTGINKKRGIACSIDLDNFNRIFPNGDDILSGQQTDLEPTYSAAVSCSNRFPFLSPAAHVEGVGHFLDGGYFENSGVLTLKNFYDYLDRDQTLSSSGRPIFFVQIINSKQEYLRNLIQGLDIEFKESSAGETTAIIDALSGIDMLPRVLEAEMQANQDLFYVPIYLPYELEKEDVDAYLGGDVVMSDALVSRLTESNAQIKREVGYADRWEYAEPALARLLGDKSADYMDVMSESDWIYGDLIEAIDKAGATN